MTIQRMTICIDFDDTKYSSKSFEKFVDFVIADLSENLPADTITNYDSCVDEVKVDENVK